MSQGQQYEMRDSGVEWIRTIPKDWSIGRLKAFFSFGKGLPITKDNLVEYGIPVISYGQIHAKYNTGVRVQNELIRYVDNVWLETNSESLVDVGDFIFADTSEDLDGCGNCVYIDAKDNTPILFAGYHTIVFNAKSSKYNKFLAYLFKTDVWRSQLRSRASGVKVFSISKKILKQTTILLPSLDEQEAIASFLDEKCTAIDEIIDQAKASIDEYKEWKASVIFEAVTKGLDPNVEMKDSGVEWIGKVPRKWTVAKQKYFITLLNGRAFADNEFMSEGKYRVLRVGNFFTNSSWYYSDLELSPEKYCDNGDLLYAWSASYGPKIWDDGKVIYHYHIWKCKLSSKIDKMFCYYYFLSLGQFAANSAHGTAMMHITMQMMNNAYIPVPSLSEQAAIAAYLDEKCSAINGIIAEKESLIDELETYKKSLIYETVTGKRRVC